MAGEAGRAAWETAGGLVRRIVGHEVAAPSDAGQRDAVARMVVDGLRREPGLAGAFASFGRSVGGSAAGGAVPQLLPASVRFFTDRREVLRRLGKEASRPADGTPRVVLLHGPDGIGTSALAVHYGSVESRRFPDGRLYADLRGGSVDRPVDPSVVLRSFLLALGVPEERIPAAVEDRAERFRAQVAGRRLLVVLDHAQSAAQVRALLTSEPGVLTVVVARRPLTGLDAVRVAVGPLADRDAVRLLTDIAGKSAVAAAKATLPALLERCGGSPYALRAAAVRLAEAPLQALGGAAEREPAESQVRDPVGTAARDAYLRLPGDAARCFRLLAARPWPAIDAAAAGAALAIPADDAESLLDVLAAAHLLEVGDGGRYSYRPAVRRFAEQQAVREDGALACAAAAGRMVDHYLRLAVVADRAAHPKRWQLGPLYRGLRENPYRSAGEALTAVVTELGNLVEAVRAAGELDDHDSAWQLCEALWAAQLRAGRHDEVLPALRIGVRAAQTVAPGSKIAGRMHTQLALALIERREYDEAEAELRAAAEADRAAGHWRGQATAVETLGLMRLRQWRFSEALELFDEAGRHLDAIAPGAEGSEDLPQARALLQRHRGRALRGLARWDEARGRLATALTAFRENGDAYNTARALTDLAEVETAAGQHAAALPLIDEAIATLTVERAEYHVTRLRVLREECVSAAAG
jgi:tetratricopeptide (TPR) repeat protein